MPGKKWSLRVFGETIELVLASEAAAGEATKRLAPIEAAWAIESIPISVPVSDVIIRAELARALEHVEGSAGRASSMTLEALRAAVAEAVRREQLVAFRTSRPMRVQREIKVEPLGPESSPDEVLDVYLLAAEVKQLGDGDKPLIEHPVRIIDPDTEEVVAEATTDEKGVVRVEVPKKKTYRIDIVELNPDFFPAPHADDPPQGRLHFRLVDPSGAPIAAREVKVQIDGDELAFVTDDDGEVSAPAHLAPYELDVGDQSFWGHTVLPSDADDDHLYEFEVDDAQHDAGDSDDPVGRLERYDVAFADDDDAVDEPSADEEESLA